MNISMLYADWGKYMKQIVTLYGEFALEAIVIGLLSFNILFGAKDEDGKNGIFRIMGSNVEVEGINYLECIDFEETYRVESSKKTPQIYFSGNHLQVGCHKLSDYILIWDYEGNELLMSINSITDMSGKEVLCNYNSLSTEMNFTDAGIYTIEVEAMDKENRIARGIIRIPVNP